jgi:hypothetical protein
MARDPALAKLHIARKELRLCEADYRAALARATGKTSAAALDEGEREKALAEFRRLGWKGKPTRNSVDRPHVGKIVALWRAAAQDGAIRDGSDAALRAFVERQTGVGAPQFLKPKQANAVIEAIKAMRARQGGGAR